MRIASICLLTVASLLVGSSTTIAKTYCKAKVDTASGGEMCTTSRCEADYPKGTVFVYECDEQGKCPVSASREGLSCSSGEARDRTRYFKCDLTFSSVTACAPLERRPR
jgi:hypothetical protein